MKVECWYIGKTNTAYLKEGITQYHKRLKHYIPFEQIIIPDVKNAGKFSADALKAKEAEAVLKKLDNRDGLILLDERGKTFKSVAFAKWMDQQLQMPYRKLIFLVGGAFGFDEKIYHRANGKLSLSAMTFSHQMVRLFLLEQIYRAMTILKNEPYHNEG